MSENKSQQPKQYTSPVLLAWETDENKKKIVFPKKSCACRRCQFMDWQVLEHEIILEDDDENDKNKSNQKQVEPLVDTEVINYCHDRYQKTWDKTMPNIPDCDGLYKAPKE